MHHFISGTSTVGLPNPLPGLIAGNMLDDLGRCAGPKKKGKRKMGRVERQRGAPPLLRKQFWSGTRCNV